MGTYFELLIEQYKQAKGITKDIDVKQPEFISEFTNWINYMNDISSNYKELLEYMELYDYVNYDTIEVGKGKFDSIVKNYNTTIVTPHSTGLNNTSNRHVITADFRVYSKPMLIRTNESGLRNLSPITSNLLLTFMTQNPYNLNSIKNWELLHTSDKYKIIVGMFGNRTDKDKTKKINALKDLRDKLEKSYKEEYAVINDSYCYVVATDKILTKRAQERIR